METWPADERRLNEHGKLELVAGPPEEKLGARPTVEALPRVVLCRHVVSGLEHVCGSRSVRRVDEVDQVDQRTARDVTVGKLRNRQALLDEDRHAGGVESVDELSVLRREDAVLVSRALEPLEKLPPRVPRDAVSLT